MELPVLSSSPRATRHWKSLAQWEDSPKFQRRAANEFPPGALDQPNDVSRRTLLKMMSAAVAAAAVSCVPATVACTMLFHR